MMCYWFKRWNFRIAISWDPDLCAVIYSSVSLKSYRPFPKLCARCSYVMPNFYDHCLANCYSDFRFVQYKFSDGALQLKMKVTHVLWNMRSGGRIPWEGRDLSHPSTPALESTQLRVQEIPDFFPIGKAAGAWRWPPIPSSTELKERVQLYLYPHPSNLGLLSFF